MVFKRYVEVGRVVLINYGPDEGKLATIVDIVDSNKCLIDGPSNLTGVSRQVISFSRIALTDLTVKVSLNARQKSLTAAWKEADTQNKWDASSWAKKLSAKKKRATLNDFDRFKVMVAKKQRSSIIAKKMKLQPQPQQAQAQAQAEHKSRLIIGAIETKIPIVPSKWLEVVPVSCRGKLEVKWMMLKFQSATRYWKKISTLSQTLQNSQNPMMMTMITVMTNPMMRMTMNHLQLPTPKMTFSIPSPTMSWIDRAVLIIVSEESRRGI